MSPRLYVNFGDYSKKKIQSEIFMFDREKSIFIFIRHIFFLFFDFSATSQSICAFSSFPYRRTNTIYYYVCFNSAHNAVRLNREKRRMQKNWIFFLSPTSKLCIRMNHRKQLPRVDVMKKCFYIVKNESGKK